jgi:hypothetical protein
MSQGETLRSAEVFEKMNAIMKMHGSEIVKRVQSTYLFEIKPSKQADPIMFTVDLKNGQGKAVHLHLYNSYGY